MGDISVLILIITSVVTFFASVVLMFYNEKLGLPIGEWIVFIFISFTISLSEIIKRFNPGFDISSKFLLIVISVSIFILVVMNYWSLLSEFNIISKGK